MYRRADLWVLAFIPAQTSPSLTMSQQAESNKTLMPDQGRLVPVSAEIKRLLWQSIWEVHFRLTSQLKGSMKVIDISTSCVNTRAWKTGVKAGLWKQDLKRLLYVTTAPPLSFFIFSLNTWESTLGTDSCNKEVVYRKGRQDGVHLLAEVRYSSLQSAAAEPVTLTNEINWSGRLTLCSGLLQLVWRNGCCTIF